MLADEAARAAGVAPGVGVAAARMLAPTISLLARDAAREAAALYRLACWAGCLTPVISVTSATLLLEIGSCLRLFGGVRELAKAAHAGVTAQGFSLAMALAPTPLAAQWLAQCGVAVLCLDRQRLHEALARLPVTVLPERAANALARFGAHTLADARRLPGADLARRIGIESVQQMARAFGELADPRPAFVFPEEFSLSLQLPAAVDNAGALLFAARRLTEALAGWLCARQRGVREIRLHLVHRAGETPLILQFAELSADGGRFERVLRERLSHLPLAAPVDSLRLEASRSAALAGRSRTLFADAASGNEAIAALLERLGARLGEEEVYRLALHDDHRPECATRRTSLFGKSAAVPAPAGALARPLWLLAAAEPLKEKDGRPWRQGPLQLLSGPERIESGWWDGGEKPGETPDENTGDQHTSGDQRRDYFIARAADARWLWIYRECRAPGGWYVQGFFS